MHLSFYAFPLLILISWAAAQSPCGPAGSVSLAGSSTVYPYALAWADGYQAQCRNAEITVEGGGSAFGAGRVCGQITRGSPVDIGNMSREWRAPEVSNNGDGTLQCKIGDTSRSVIQVAIALDGISVVVITGGAGDTCIGKKGLTRDQLRWVYSSYTFAQLNATGWNVSSLPNSDNNDATHLWSELDPRCAPVEIKIGGPDDLSGTFDFFRENILTDYANGETFGFNRPNGYYNSADDVVLVTFVETSSFANYGDAIVFFGFSYYDGEGAKLVGVPIQNATGQFVAPTTDSIETGVYNPLSRRLYMNFFNSPSVIAKTAPFLAYGFSPFGTARLAGLPIPESERAAQLARLGWTPPAPTPAPIAPVPAPPVCGILGLSIFCPFSFCGIIGRLLGLCQS
jgi:ABC-type phosphate transport system substrate-binding protein